MDSVGYALANNLKAETIKYNTTDITNFPKATNSQTSFVIGNKLYASGGFDGSYGGDSKVYVYDMDLKTWAVVSGFTLAPKSRIATFDNDTFYILNRGSLRKYTFSTGVNVSLASAPVSGTAEAGSLGVSANGDAVWCTLQSSYAQDKYLFKYTISSNSWASVYNIEGGNYRPVYFDKSSNLCYFAFGFSITTFNLSTNQVVSTNVLDVSLPPFAQGFFQQTSKSLFIFGAVDGSTFGNYIIKVDTVTSQCSHEASFKVARIGVLVAYDHCQNNPKQAFILCGAVNGPANTSGVEQIDLDYTPKINGIENLKSWLART